ncbi:hypothetical protein EDD22DRAFT_12179 [Suillus occidentalis]|nr:hypothetical protein EDD22DRAFT_12179 [Suillus occidentalis]
MTFISNDPSLWPILKSEVFYSYWTVAAGIVVVYDWALTIGQEIELIWRQRWSLMTVLYLVIRYIGIPYSITNVLETMTLISLTDVVSHILYNGTNGIIVVIIAMLDVIMIFRLHAMYQRSRIILIILVIIFLGINIACGVLTAITLKHVVVEELILSGMHMCVLALCLSVWIAVKHFRDLRSLGPSTGSIIGDCFRVLIKSHVLYFASFAGVSCVQLIFISPATTNFVIHMILDGGLQVLLVMQMFVLGPRLILSVREYHAKLTAGSDADTSMTSLVFQERVHVSTSNTV